jgi:hypothetical protein
MKYIFIKTLMPSTIPNKPISKDAKGKTTAGADKSTGVKISGGKIVASNAGAKAAPSDPRDPTGHFAYEFERIDRNKDGWLSPQELHHGLLNSGWEQDQVCGLFDFIDTNHDGKITKEEFISYRSQQKTQDMALDPSQVLSQFDEDKDGGLNLRELAKLIKSVNEREGFLIDNDVGTYIKEQLADADKDGDKKLSMAEFVPWYDNFIRHVEDFREKEEQQQREKEVRTASSAPGKPAAAAVADNFSGAGLWECPLTKLMEGILAAQAKGRTPLLIDGAYTLIVSLL